MLVVAMTFAAVAGVLQVAVLGAATRSVSVRTLLVAVGAGFYCAGIGAVLVESLLAHGLAAARGTFPLTQASLDAWTVDPFVEELFKIAPLFAVGYLVARVHRQWGLTDFVLVAAALGSGFGLLEAVARYARSAGIAIRSGGDWVVPVNLSPPVIPGFWHAASGWVQAPAGQTGLFSTTTGSGTSMHLAWSAVAGLGVGLWFRTTGARRWLGSAVPLLLVGTAHAAFNDLAGHTVLAPFDAAHGSLWAWPLLALAAATVLDLRVLRSARPATAELDRPDLTTSRLLDYARVRVPWTTLVATAYMRGRRAVRYETAATGGRSPLIDVVTALGERIEATSSRSAWADVRLRKALRQGEIRWRQPRVLVPVTVWALLVLPPVVYYLLGTTKPFTGIQKVFQTRIAFDLLLALAVLGTVWLIAVIWIGVRALLRTRDQPAGDVLARLQLRIATALGAALLGAVTLTARLDGHTATSLLPLSHVIDALDNLPLYVGLVLLLLALLPVFPVGVGLLITETGLVGGITVETAAIAVQARILLGLAGIAGIMLSQAEGPGPRPSGGSVGPTRPVRTPRPDSRIPDHDTGLPDIPQKPPAKVPNVQDPRLQKIFNDAYRDPKSDSRIGDGSTMDALRNERATGRSTEGRWHDQKVLDLITRLTRWGRETRMPHGNLDRRAAEDLLKKLTNVWGEGQ